jgi:hypothetical protein
MDTQPRDRSFFWPIVLIGAGVIWLLANFGLVQDLSWTALFRLWPLALIAAGLDILFGRSHPLIGALIGLLTVGVAVALLVAGPRLGLAPAAPELRTETFTEPLEGATSAEISLDLASFPTTVSALDDSSVLFDAVIPHRGQVRFTTSGTAQRQVRLDESSGPGLFIFDLGTIDAEWRIGLSPEVPLRLVVDAGSGASELDLAELNLTALDIDAGSGAVTLSLPAAEAVDVRLAGGSGAQSVHVPAGLGGTLTYDGGSGTLSVTVADTAAVRLDVRDSGSGSVRVPAGWDEIEDGDNDEGVWQSAAYDEAAGQALLIIVDDLGSGQVAVNQE